LQNNVDIRERTMTNFTDYSEILSKTSASTISDVLDQLGIEGHCSDILPASQSFKCYGRAHTVRLGAQSEPPEPYEDYQEDLLPGEVCVMEARGVPKMPCWGDLRSLAAQKRGVAGTIIEGLARDITATLEIGYPVFARAMTMRGSRGRITIEATQVPVSIDGILVRPGDIVYGDADGVVVIPQSREAEVMERVKQVEESEAKIIAAIKEGYTIKEARKMHRFQPPKK